MKCKFFYLILILWLQACSSRAQTSVIKVGNTDVLADTVITGIDIPWEILWGPDNYLWITERIGIVSRIDPDNGNKTVILDIRNSVYQSGESGLLGMALHPDFSTTPEVFLVYTYGNSSDIKERLVKYRYNGTQLVDPDTLIEGIPGNTTHDGSRLLFLPDKTLLMTTGDAQNQSAPQNMSSLNGKVLRLNPDGSIPADNPVQGSYVYSFGHRNAQGLAAGPGGNIYLSEHGPNTDDEMMMLMKGRNYGWPTVRGFCNLPGEQTFCSANNVVEPLAAWTPTIAPADLVYYINPGFPEWDSCLLMTVLKDMKLVALKMNPDGTKVLQENHYLTNAFGRLRDICIGPQNEIYLATNGLSWSNDNPNTHSIIRLKPDNLTSVDKPKAQAARIYPNPSGHSVTISLPNPSGRYLVHMLDAAGRLMLEQEVSESTNVSLEHLPGGIYLVRIVQKGVVLLEQKVSR